MKLADALRIAQRTSAGERPFSLFLACGFTPLHLQTFLVAYLCETTPGLRPLVQSGLYGDCPGNIERMADAAELDAAVVALEWADFEPRLGIRQLGGWSPKVLPDILETAAGQIERLERAIARAAETIPVSLSLPTLPLPPLTHDPGWRAGWFELELRNQIGAFAARLAHLPLVNVVSEQRLALRSPMGERLDVAAELRSGFPYSIAHACALAELLAAHVYAPTPKKGLITDLDDTLWAGILGEVGHTGVSWRPEDHNHVHGLYQQFLGSLSDAGVLVGVASRNDQAAVALALEREDLVLRKDRIFPVEVECGAKSAAVARILRTWNLGAHSVVFVDDSALELAEVKAAHPEITCLQFHPQDERAAFDLLVDLRDLFGKRSISVEDGLRIESLRNHARSEREIALPAPAHADRFLAAAEAELTVRLSRNAFNPRPLELVNKTNQFNLNGRRCLEAAWRRSLQDAARFLLVIGYRDKYGPLGDIAVLGGRTGLDALLLDTWVMSCRAFARRIEFRCLELLFAKFDAETLELDFEPTARNAPLRELLARFGLPTETAARLHLPRSVFVANCPALHHRVQELT